MTITLRIIGFHNCEGCIRKARIALRELGVELVEFNPEGGIFTVSTVKHPEVIRYALERKSKKKVVILYTEINRTSQNINSIIPRQGTLIAAQGTNQVQDLAEVFMRRLQVEGLDGVEFTHTNTYRLTFNHRLNRPPWLATEPSAPLIPAVEEEVYGYPPELYGLSTTCRHDRQSGCCTIM